MAKQKTDKTVQEKALKELNEGEKKKSVNGIVFTILAVLTALMIMFTVVGGAAYIVLHNNINGLGEKSRPSLQGNRLLRWMLPSVPNPEDPKYIPDDEIRNKYVEMKKTRDELLKQLEEANKNIQELQKYRTNENKINEELEANKKAMQAQQAQVDEQKKKLADERAKLDQVIATSDKAGFKEFYEKLNKETAQKIYAEIMKEQKASEDARKFSQLYETMEPSASAKIFEQMGASKTDLIIDILKNIKKETTAEILAAMDPAFASKLTEKMSQLYLAPKK